MPSTPVSDALWVKSSHSAYGNCVEIARLASRTVGVRDSWAPHTGGVLSFPGDVWGRFLAEAKSGRHDLRRG